MGRKIKEGVTFTQIPNCPIQDRRLTWADLGVLSFLWTLDYNWQFSIQGLVNCRGGGIKATGKIIRHLEETGYLKRVQTRKGRQYGPSIFILNEEPPGAAVPDWFKKYMKNETSIIMVDEITDSLKEDSHNKDIRNEDILGEVSPNRVIPEIVEPHAVDNITNTKLIKNQNKKVYTMPTRRIMSDIDEADVNDLQALIKEGV